MMMMAQRSSEAVGLTGFDHDGWPWSLLLSFLRAYVKTRIPWMVMRTEREKHHAASGVLLAAVAEKVEHPLVVVAVVVLCRGRDQGRFDSSVDCTRDHDCSGKVLDPLSLLITPYRVDYLNVRYYDRPCCEAFVVALVVVVMHWKKKKKMMKHVLTTVYHETPSLRYRNDNALDVPLPPSGIHLNADSRHAAVAVVVAVVAVVAVADDNDNDSVVVSPRLLLLLMMMMMMMT